MGQKKTPKYKGVLADASPVSAANQVEVADIGIKEDTIIDGIEQL